MNSTKEDTFIILTPAFAAYEGDSWLPAQENLVLALSRNFPSLKIVILTFHYPVLKEKYYQWYDNSVIAYSGGMKGGKYNSLLRWRYIWRELRALTQKRRTVGIFSFFCSECAFVGHYFAKRFGLKHHIWVLGQDARKENKQVRRIRPEADELVCISDFLFREFKHNHHITPSHIIPIGIDTSLYENQVLPRNITILGAGSLIPLKQYDVFIEIVRLVSMSYPQFTALICGDGPERERLQLLINKSGLDNQLSIAGKLAPAQVLETMQQTKILLHTSGFEGFGAVCLEALYAGCHVVSFCKPMDITIPHWHIVESANDMVAKVCELLADENLDHTPILPFDINKIAVDIMQLFNYGN